MGLLVSTIFLEIILGERLGDFVYVLPGLKLKWPLKHANQGVGIHVIVQETPRMHFTLQDIQHEAEFRLLDLDKLFIGPGCPKAALLFCLLLVVFLARCIPAVSIVYTCLIRILALRPPVLQFQLPALLFVCVLFVLFLLFVVVLSGEPR